MTIGDVESKEEAFDLLECIKKDAALSAEEVDFGGLYKYAVTADILCDYAGIEFPNDYFDRVLAGAKLNEVEARSLGNQILRNYVARGLKLMKKDRFLDVMRLTAEARIYFTHDAAA